MSNKKLTILAIAAVLMVVWAVLQNRVSTKRSFASEPAYLVQGLNADDIGAIVVGTADDKIVFNRRGKDFVVANKDSYPADAQQINSLITNCLDLQVADLVTSNKDNHADLGVTEGSANYVIKFFDIQAKPITAILLSATDTDTRRGYGRLDSSDNVYLMLSPPWFGTSAMAYVDKNILTVDTEQIESVTVNLPSQSYTLRPDAEGKIAPENIPDGKNCKYTDCQEIFAALGKLSFKDVSIDNSDVLDLQFEKSYVCNLKDSTVYKIDIAEKDEKFYIKCSAEFTEDISNLAITKDEPEEELKKKEAKLLARDSAENFTDNHKQWLYIIEDFKAKNMTKELSELFEDAPQQQPTEPDTE